MQEFIYVIRPTRDDMLASGLTAGEQRTMGEHFAYLQKAMTEGKVLLAGRTQTTDTSGFGLCIFRAADLPAANAFTSADPAVAAGVVRAEVFPYKVALHAKVW
jgi:uncharacterized protein YciI